MEPSDVLTLTPIDHPDERVSRVGFDLTSPYVEQCWGPVVGPSATMLLRRMPTLWTERVPATITHRELARSLGLGGGTANNSRLAYTLDRINRFGLATWDRQAGTLDVYLQVAGLTQPQLHRLPEWTQRAHERLLDSHVRQLDEHQQATPRVAAITTRLDRLQQPRSMATAAPVAHAWVHDQ